MSVTYAGIEGDRGWIHAQAAKLEQLLELDGLCLPHDALDALGCAQSTKE